MYLDVPVAFKVELGKTTHISSSVNVHGKLTEEIDDGRSAIR